MVMLMEMLTIAVPIMWLGMTAWFFPAVLRISRLPRHRWGKWDPALAALSYLSFNIFWFGSRRWVFGSRVDLMSDPEIVWRIGTLVCSVIGVLILLRVVRFYKQIG